MIKHLLPLLLIIATLRAETPTLALLAADDAARAAGELLIATRGGEGMVWVEREQREALLKERSIFLHRTRADGQDFDLRRWVEADILLVVETFEAEQSQLWLRALDVVTGVRLAEELLRSDIQRPDAGAAALDTLLRDQVIPAWKQLWREGERFHGITLLDITLVDATDPERRALAPVAELVQRMVVRHPDLILMERELLETLLREESLSPALRLKLRSGGVLLRGILHREAEGPVFTLQGLSTGRDTLFEKRIPLTERDQAVDLAVRILRELLVQVEGREPASRNDLRGESARFHQLARYYRSRSDTARALEAARRAWALDPRQARNRKLYYELLYDNLDGRRRRVSRTNVAEIEAYFQEVGFLMDLLAPDEKLVNQYLPENMVSQTERFFASEMEKNPSLWERWEQALNSYKRSVHDHSNIQHFSPFPIYSRHTEEERDTLFRHAAEFDIPLDFQLMGYSFGRLPPRGGIGEPVVHMNPLPLETTLRLIEQTLNRPAYRVEELGDNLDAQEQYPFIINLVLSSLYFVASRQDDMYAAQTRHHMRQMALYVVEHPLRWKYSHHLIALGYDPEYIAGLREVFVETREWLEEQGWFLPEFYFLDPPDQLETVMHKATSSPLNFISLFAENDSDVNRREEMLLRMESWKHPGSTVSVRPQALDVEESLTPETVVRAPRRIRDSRVIGEYLAALVRVDGTRTESSLALKVYRRAGDNAELQNTFRFPDRAGDMRIDPNRTKLFFDVFLGGREHLYVTHQHSLYRLDQKREILEAFHLEDWGFPDHMVSSVLETDQGVWIALTKHYYWQQDSTGRYDIAGGVLILADRDLKTRTLVSNVERPEPENDLYRFGPFCVTSMTLEPDGSILLTHGFLNHVYFQIGPDHVPRRMQALRGSAFFSRWERMLKEAGSWPDGESLEAFYTETRRNFELPDPRFFPFLRRRSHERDLFQILRFQGDTVFYGSSSTQDGFRSPPGVFAMFDQDGRVVSSPVWSNPRDDLQSLALWGEQLVLVTRDEILLIPFGSWNHRMILETVKHPALEHLSADYHKALAGLRAEIRESLDPLRPTPVEVPKSEALHAMVTLPAGTLTRFSSDGKEGGAAIDSRGCLSNVRHPDHPARVFPGPPLGRAQRLCVQHSNLSGRSPPGPAGPAFFHARFA